MKTLPIILLTLAIAIPATWYVSRGSKSLSNASSGTEQKIHHYQCAMHPWVKSDKPGRCTICAMELTEVTDQQSSSQSSGDVIALNQSMVQVLNVQTVEAKKQPLDKTLTFAGTIDDDARRHRIISAYVDGRIDKLYINHHGAEVDEGKPLAEIYSPTLLQAERDYRSLSGELRQSTALRLRQLGLTPSQIADLPKKSPAALTSEILSPISGTVVNDEVYAGQYVKAGDKLFEVADFSVMWFVFQVYEQDIPWIKLDQAVEITTPAVPGTTFKGKVSFIDPNLDPDTRATQVRVELPNPIVDGRRVLLHRLYGEAVVFSESAEVLTVPRSALLRTGPEAVVYVDRGEGNYERRIVKAGGIGETLAEIRSGLEPGEKVVTNGNLLIDGQAEMNRSFSASPQTTVAITVSLNETQRVVLQKFVEAIDAAAAALAADDLKAFNGTVERIRKNTEELIASFANEPTLAETLKGLDPAQRLQSATDLKAARVAFHPIASASTAFLEPLRKSDSFTSFEIFECPMVDRVVDGAPEKGRWVQTLESKIRNPYLGKIMLECGTKIQP